MPPHSSTSFEAMPDAVMDAGTTRWPSETPCKPSSLWSIAKKSPWRSFKKSSSKISPRLSPPKDLPKKASSMSHEKKTKPTGSKVLANDKSSQDFLQQDIHGEIGQAHHDKTSSVDDNIVVVFQNGRMVNDKVEELRLGLEEEQEQSHDDVHEISSAVAREVGTHKSIPIAFLDAYMKDEGPAIDSNVGPYLIKIAKAHASGENPVKGLEYCIRAVKYYEGKEAHHDDGESSSLNLVISLHVLAALHCQLGQYEDAVSVLERSLTIPDMNQGEEHALAIFAGHMQLGDTLNLAGKQGPALQSYHAALQVQKSVVGEFDLSVAETCNYIAEAHLQAMEFVDAKKMCGHALLIHTNHCDSGSLEEARDRKLLATIHTAEGDHGKALDSLVYANSIFVEHAEEVDVATTNSSIGDCLLALGRDGEALLCYEKVLMDFKNLKGDNHSLVALAFVNLAEFHLRTNKPGEAKSYCEAALRIYGKQGAGHAPGDVAHGLADIAAILEQLNEKETALFLLQRAFNILDKAPGSQIAVSGIEAQIGILHYMMEDFELALDALRSAAGKIKDGIGKTTALFGMILNQIGLTLVELGDIKQAVAVFEEAKDVFEQTSGADHLDTLDVCNNLAGTYDALGRIEDAITLLEEMLEVKEEKLGTMHPDVQDDRQRLHELLNQQGRITSHKKSRKLVELLSNARKVFQTSK
ncbi:unnamed protein product [Sphagnum troendelagicum]|uniref:Uncharacterized protein n=1 Tax=Sphagnum troendelagicum TaxID=128251 RepID=A0ABP0T9X8_9BRYO